MKIYNNLDNFEKIAFPVVTIGSFDGVHIGHKALIAKMTNYARKNNGETVLITFNPHPRVVLFPDRHDLKLINTPDEKVEQMHKAKIDNLVMFPFTIEFSKIKSIDFIRKVLVEKIGTKMFIIGYDHHFGNNREGDFEYLYELGKYYNFEVEEISAQDVNEISVSSTKIRNAINDGKIETANQFLGYTFSLQGKVVKGFQIGRTLGYPTANIDLSDKLKIIPAHGVYAVWIKIKDQLYKGMLNIGIRPTINAEVATIEVNIFDFEQDIYNHSIRVFFIGRIRDEEKFSGLDALKDQLALDKLKALEILKEEIIL